METRGPVVLAVTAAMLSAASLFVFLRLMSRCFIVKRVGLDDYFIIAAWVFSFGLSFSICYAVNYGLGQHQETISSDRLDVLERLEYTFSNPALMATKTSICVFYLTLSTTQQSFRRSVIATIVVVNTAGLALSLLNIFQCRPLSATFLNPRPDSATCTDIITLYLSSAPVNIITDLVILLLPMPVLKKMRLPKKQKIILYITFGFGIFVTAVDIIRIAYLQSATEHRLEDQARPENAEKPSNAQQDTDFSWYASLSFMWSAIEVNVGIMVASVPHLKPLVIKFLPRMIREKGEITPEHRPSIPTIASGEPGDMRRITSMATTIHRLDTANGTTRADSLADIHDLSFFDFLAEQPRLNRTSTRLTAATAGSPSGTSFLNFVDVSEAKSIVNMSNRESVKPIAMVTFIFFIWGFAYGLLNSLNGQFQIVAKMSTGETITQHGMYYAGYFVGPLTIGRFVFKKWGFKACYIIGLMIYGTGTLIFWPAAVLTSFGAFLASNFIVGLGLSTLEISANPFIALCGPARYAEVRLNLSQAIQAMGTVVSPLLAQKVFFNDVTSSQSLVDVQWTYLAISLGAYILAFWFYALKLPGARDDQLEDATRKTYSAETLTLLHEKNVIWITLGLGVFAQFLYLGSQEAVSTSFAAYLGEVLPGRDAVDFQAIGHALFAVSRLLAAGICIFVKPRHVLLVFVLGCIIFSALAMSTARDAALSMVMMVYFFQGPLFGLFYALPLRAMGKHTKDGATLLTAAISGGAVFVPIQYAVTKAHDVQYSYCVIVAAFAALIIFSLYLQLYTPAKLQTNPPTIDLSKTPVLPEVQTSGSIPNTPNTPTTPTPELRLTSAHGSTKSKPLTRVRDCVHRIRRPAHDEQNPTNKETIEVITTSTSPTGSGELTRTL